MTKQTNGLTADQKERFAQNGFLAYGPILSVEESQTMGAHIDAIADGKVPENCIRIDPDHLAGKLPGVPRHDVWWQMVGLAQFDDAINNLTRNPCILDIMESLIGPDIKLFRDQVLIKPAFRPGSAGAWHQDAYYWSIEPMNLVTCWLALDAATLENGCLCFIPGTHREGLKEHKRQDHYTEQVTDLDTSRMVVVPVPIGGCEFHHSLVLHGTGENNTPFRRRAIVMTYMSARNKDLKRPTHRYPLLRGQEYCGCV